MKYSVKDLLSQARVAQEQKAQPHLVLIHDELSLEGRAQFSAPVLREQQSSVSQMSIDELMKLIA